MKTELEQAAADMQSKVGVVTAPGSVMRVNDADGMSVSIRVDRFDILFARPVIASDGSLSGHYCWAVCFEVGFDQGGPQNVRLLKMANIRQERDDLIRFTDHRGRSCYIESIDVIDTAKKADFKMWRKYKAENEAAFAARYADFTDEAMEMALNYERN